MRKFVTVLLVIAVLVTFLVPVNVFAATGSIWATPNPVPIYPGQSLGTATITWTSSGTTAVQVWISQDGAAENLFSATGSGTNSASAPWISQYSTYVFRLYDYSSGARGPLLAACTVTGTVVAPSGSIWCSSHRHEVPPYSNITIDRVTISFSSNCSQVQFSRTQNGGSEYFYNPVPGSSGTQTDGWQHGTTVSSVTYKLYDYSSGSRGALLSSVTVYD